MNHDGIGLPKNHAVFDAANFQKFRILRLLKFRHNYVYVEYVSQVTLESTNPISVFNKL